jgi:rRNA maturation endonuclease Nob1
MDNEENKADSKGNNGNYMKICLICLTEYDERSLNFCPKCGHRGFE